MTEQVIQSQICQYIKSQYKDVIFISDLSGIPLSIGLAKKIKNLKSGRGVPDIVILEPRAIYYGLLIELKADGKLFKKSGELFKNEHLKEQKELLDRLKLKGYCAGFAEGFESAKRIIDKYMALPINYKK